MAAALDVTENQRGKIATYGARFVEGVTAADLGGQQRSA